MDVPQFDFGKALKALKQGHTVSRVGWNGKGQYLLYVPGSTFTTLRKPLSDLFEQGTEITYRPHIDLMAADGTLGTWAPSMSDILATDWFLSGGL